jgi:serine/threonine protein kinase
MVHRDIKPANLLVDREGVVKVLDMGLAKFTSESRAVPAILAEHVLGTADYLAPEQAVNSQSVDRRADIYALGCTLYFLLTGHPPFVVGTSLERMTAHRQDEPASLLVDRPDTPSALVTICQRMMEKSPADRYATAEEVRRALAAWLETESATGRVNTCGLVAAARAVPRASEAETARTEQVGPSSVDLISGSHADLPPPPPEIPPLAPALQDTDLNLHRATIKLPSGPGSARYALTESHVLRLSEPGGARPGSGSSGSLGSGHPAAPPVVAPPLSDSFVLAPPPVERPAGTALATTAVRRHDQVSGPQSGPQRFWIVLISTMLITALILLIATS